MAISFKHKHTATGSEAGNGEVGKSEWNDEHDLTGTSGHVLGFDGNGDAEEVAITQSATDTTAGRLMKVGDFSLGSELAVLASEFGDDLNSIAITCFVRTTGTTANKPSALGDSLVVLTQMWSDGAGVQTARDVTTGRAATRSKISGVWGTWREIYHQNSILGTVSESAGVPTGAVIERGSNANGEYVKFADGTMHATNGNTAITTNPATFVGTVTDIDSSKLRMGFWY